MKTPPSSDFTLNLETSSTQFIEQEIAFIKHLLHASIFKQNESNLYKKSPSFKKKVLEARN